MKTGVPNWNPCLAASSGVASGVGGFAGNRLQGAKRLKLGGSCSAAREGEALRLLSQIVLHEPLEIATRALHRRLRRSRTVRRGIQNIFDDTKFAGVTRIFIH